MLFNPFDYPICLEFPYWVDRSAWTEHIPFGMFLVAAARPKKLVELGTYHGVSYCAFCQAVKAARTGTLCYAVDTWEGDGHAGTIEGSVLNRLRKHHDPLYGDFSTLLQSKFDDAARHFADGSIDLLHIDGFHTYNAVKHDFHTWLPKMSSRGIVLFHDLSERRDDFGVWKFWEEVGREYKSFTFTHGHGLGVLAVGDHQPPELESIFSADEATATVIRKFFHRLGNSIEVVNHYHNQNEYIDLLKTHEKVVLKSPVMRLYRVLRFEGLRSLLRKASENKPTDRRSARDR